MVCVTMTDPGTANATDEELAPVRGPGRRRWRRAIIALPLTVMLLVSGAYVATASLEIPPPPTLIKLLTVAPSEQGTLYDSRTAPATDPRPLRVRPAPLPETVPWRGGRIGVGEFLAVTNTNALLVLRDGALTHEWYRDGVAATTRMPSWSVAKSIVSLLVGQSIEAGRLSEDDRLVDVLPELATGGRYDEITVRDLLDMTAAVDVSENYNPYLPLTGAARMYLTRDLGEFVRDHRGVTAPPGSVGDYRSVHTQLLGQALARVEGASLSELLAERLWGPMGAEDDATWNLDRDGGQEKGFCCVNATARDYAKIGQLVLDGGRAGDRQVVPASWIARIGEPAPREVSGWGYSAQWWHPSGGDGADLSALGVYGQYLYVDPATGVVIVKLSDHGDEQDEQETFDALRAIAAHGDGPGAR